MFEIFSLTPSSLPPPSLLSRLPPKLVSHFLWLVRPAGAPGSGVSHQTRQSLPEEQILCINYQDQQQSVELS